MRKKILALTLSVMMAAGVMAMTGVAFAAEKAQSTEDELAKNMIQSSEGLYDYTNDKAAAKAVKKAEKSLPESFDLRNVDGTSYVTPVKFQNPFGTCWGFAAISAAETAILGSGLAAQDGYDASSLDLSEKQLAYFTFTALNDPTDPQNGEGLASEKEMTASERLNQGGRAFTATSMFSSGIGPNLESRDPLFQYRGANGWTEKRFVDGEYEDYCFLDTDDWSLPESDRFKQSYVLKESYILPSPAIIDYQKQKYTYNSAGTAAIKEQLYQKRAVQIGYDPRTYVNDEVSNNEGSGSCISSHWAQYIDGVSSPGHAVCIVGWDDNYPVSNFASKHQPPGPGAWLVKNSWGSGEVDAPNKGEGDWGYIDPKTGKHTGYFWLSYYDQSIATPEAIAFDKSNVNNSYRLDQHDYMPVNDAYGANASNEVQSANVFKADVSERVEQVSCQTCAPDSHVVYQVYLLRDDFEDPTDGKLMDTEEADYQYGGYHKIDLQNPVIVQKGQSYSIVVTQTTKEGKYQMSIPTAYGELLAKEDKNVDTWMKGIVNSKESFLKMDGSWKDWSDTKLQKKLLKYVIPEDAKYLVTDNFPIKGYAKELDMTGLSMYIEVGESFDLEYENERSDTLRLRFKGDAGASPAADTKITWELAEDGDRIFDLAPGNNPAEQVLTAKAYGYTDVYVTAEGLGTIVYRTGVMLPFPDIFIKTGKKQMKVTAKNWQKIEGGGGILGYQIRYRAKGDSKWKTKTVKADPAVTTIKKLKSGKKYQVQARSFTKVNNQIQYGDWKSKISKKIR